MQASSLHRAHVLVRPGVGLGLLLQVCADGAGGNARGCRKEYGPILSKGKEREKALEVRFAGEKRAAQHAMQAWLIKKKTLRG